MQALTVTQHGKNFEQEIADFRNKGGIDCFEIERTEGEYEIFNIHISRNYQWIAAGEYERRVSMRIETCFSLDEHLQALRELIQENFNI